MVSSFPQILFFSSLIVHTVYKFDTVSLQPDSGYLHVCPGDSVEVTCTSTNTFLLWGLSIPDEITCEGELFSVHSKTNYTSCDFVFTLVSANFDFIVSTATLENAGLDYNGSVLTCSSSIAVTPEANKKASTTLFVQGVNRKFYLINSTLI